MTTPLGYPHWVWDLFRNTPHAGRFAAGMPGVHAAESGTPAGRARLRLEWRIEKNLIADSRFQAFGCPYTIATGAWLAGWCIGREPAEAAALTAPEVTAALEIPEDRAHCSLMAEDVVRAMLAFQVDPR